MKFKTQGSNSFIPLLLFLIVMVYSCTPTQKAARHTEGINPQNIPETPREMRAAWVASVANIDWPSEPGLPVSRQKAELRALMDRVSQLNMNAIILQVRPSADALYDSPFEPWSVYLTSKQGQPPEPYYDPLEFAVDEAHRRGLELHAWFNPFRAYHHAADSISGFAETHIKNRKPELVLEYGRYHWLDPGQEDARLYSLNVILDVARRYDIDGVHLDDYFYPYAELDKDGKAIPFPDSASYKKYVSEIGLIELGDWRRQNINRFVEQLHDKLKQVKPQVRFGISPFGIWRPGHPQQIEGFDAYAKIYADSKKWINEGWVDYLTPQLYWPIEQIPQSYPVLLEWWDEQNFYQRHLWPGNFTSKVGGISEETWSSEEIEKQIQLTRQNPDASGNIHFSVQALMKNAGNISGALLMNEYATPALVPATTWLAEDPPRKPKAHIRRLGDQLAVTLGFQNETEPWLWVIKAKYGNHWIFRINPGWKQSVLLPAEMVGKGPFQGAVVSVVNRLGIESAGQLLGEQGETK